MSKLTSLEFSTLFELPNHRRVEKKAINNTATVQNLEIRVPELTINYINYLKTFFPAGSLNKLWVIMDEIDLYDWTHDVGLDVALDFVHYLGTFPNGRVIAMPTKGYAKRNPIRVVGSKMTRFFRLLGALKGDRKLTCDAVFTDNHSAEGAMGISDSKNLSFQYGLEYEDFLVQFYMEGIENELFRAMNVMNEEHEEATKRIRSIEMPLSDVEKSLVGPEIFNTLTISFSTVNETVPCSFFKYALVNCPNLSYLDVKCVATPGFKIRAMPSQDYYHGTKKKLGPSTTTAETQDNLKVIKLLEDIALDQALLDLIASHLPNVEEIACQGDKWDRHIFGSKIVVPKNVKINLEALKNLKVFSLDLNALVPNDFRRLLLHFKYTDGEDCYSIEKGKNDEDGKKKLGHDGYVSAPLIQEIKEANEEEGVQCIRIETDKIKQFNLCHNNDSVAFAQFQHGVHQEVATIAPNSIPHLF